MAKLRALLFREWRLNRKAQLLQLLLTLLYAGMMWAACLSTMYGDSLEDPADRAITLRGMIQLPALMLALLSGCLGLSMDLTLKSDLESGWLRYSYALPITPRDRVLARMLRSAVATGIGTVFSLLNIAGLCALADQPFEAGYVVMQVAVVALVLLMTVLNDCFILGARSPEHLKKRTNQSGLALTGVGLLAALWFYKFGGERFLSRWQDPDGVIDLMQLFSLRRLLWLLPLTLVLIACHYGVMYWRLRCAEGTSLGSSRTKASKPEDRSIRIQGHFTGFFYKELRQNRQGILLVVLLPAALQVLIALMLLFVELTSPEFLSNGVIAILTNSLVRCIGTAIAAFCVSGMLTGVFLGDDKKLWGYFVVSTPAGIRGAMYSKYLLLALMNVLYLAAWYVTDCCLATLRYFAVGEEAPSLLGLYVAVFFLLLLLSALDIPFIVRYGAKRGSIIKLIYMLSLAILFTVIFAMVLPETIRDRLIQKAIDLYHGQVSTGMLLAVGLYPWGALTAYCLSYKLSCKLFLKGVNRYD